MIDLFNYARRKTTVAHVGALNIGGENPVRIQSMTTTSTDDTEGSVAQAKRIIDAGGELVRLTTQGKREAENLQHINAGLRAAGYTSVCRRSFQCECCRCSSALCRESTHQSR